MSRFVSTVQSSPVTVSSKEEAEERSATGAGCRSRQGERLIPQAVYAHIRGLAHGLWAYQHFPKSPRPYPSTLGNERSSLTGVAHNVDEDRPLPEMTSFTVAQSVSVDQAAERMGALGLSSTCASSQMKVVAAPWRRRCPLEDSEGTSPK